MAAEAAPRLTPAQGAAAVKARARQIGFSAAGITDLAPVPHGAEFDDWIEHGYDGTMAYMRRQAERRRNPALIAPWARRAVVVLYNYATPEPEARERAGHVARYARGPDYHHALVPALEALEREIRSVSGPDTRTRSFLDAGPVPERELAQRAGLGWIGKNTMLIRPGTGSYTFIASVFTDADLTPDGPFTADRCGTCTRCLAACPTQAFPASRVLDARRCIAYLTIEHRGELPDGLGKQVGSWVFGCDVCQDVCPWNRKVAAAMATPVIPLDPARAWIAFDTFRELDEQGFDREYGWTPLERPGVSGMRRNMDNAERNAPRGRRRGGQQ